MAVKEMVEMTYEEVLEYLKPVTKEEYQYAEGTTAQFKATYIRNERKDKIVGSVAERTGYHPLGYGAWDRRILMKEDGKFYAEWSRSNTCD